METKSETNQQQKEFEDWFHKAIEQCNSDRHIETEMYFALENIFDDRLSNELMIDRMVKHFLNENDATTRTEADLKVIANRALEVWLDDDDHAADYRD